MTAAYYRPLGDGRFAPTEWTEGAWNPGEQHLAVATGLIVHELEAVAGGEGKRLSRVSIDVLGLIHRDEFEITTRVARPGRRVELLELEWAARGRTAITARAWRLATEDTRDAEGVEDERLPGPEQGEELGHLSRWAGRFVQTLECRTLPGHRPGAARVWLRTGHELIEGAPPTVLSRLAGMIDVANGTGPRVSPHDGWRFPNVDLQVHLHREPAGEWLGLDVRQQLGPDGVGLTSSVLHDLDGPFGRAEQMLFVRRGGH